MKHELDKRFKPKLDQSRLYRFREAAWKAYYDKQFANAAEVGEHLAQHLEMMFPAEDMKVLEKYGQAEKRKTVHVSILNPETKRWDVNADIPLGRSVLVPAWRGNLYCGGPRYSEMPERGLTEQGRKDVESGEWGQTWEEFCAAQDKHDREMVPKELEPFFDAIVSERKRYTDEQKYSPARGEDGKYPTWREIAAVLPVTGPHIITELEREQ